MNKLVIIQDELILLRPPAIRDEDAVYGAVRESLAELGPWLDWATEAYDLSATRRWLDYTQAAWEHGSAFPFAIIEKGTQEYIGNCGLDGVNPDKRSCSLSYWVRTSRRGQGIASRAARLAARYAVQVLGLQRIEIVIASGNRASMRTAEKAGARFEGAKENGIFVRNDAHEAVLFSFCAADFEG